MNQAETKKNRMGKGTFWQQIIFLFLIGFFAGGVFYYIFQNSFTGLIESFDLQRNAFTEKHYSLPGQFVQAVWKHGRFFGLFWLLSVTRIQHLYQSAFLLYTGFCNGFLVLFFVFGKGVSGILLYLASLFPQAVLFVPLYLFSFAWVRGKGHHREHKKLVGVMLAVTFLAACFLEVKYNFAWMESIFSETL